MVYADALLQPARAAPVTRKYNRGISEAQSNAEALARRGMPYSGEFRATTAVAWDWRARVGPNVPLRELVRMAQRACAEEVPTKLHDATNLAQDGTPKMTAKAEAFIFGGDSWTDAGRAKCAGEATCREFQTHEQDCPVAWSDVDPEPEKGYPWLQQNVKPRFACPCRWQHHETCPANAQNRPAISYYQTPFRAALEKANSGDEKGRLYAAIVQGITIGGQGPQEAALQAGVAPRCVAKDVAEDALRWILAHLTDVRVDSPCGAVA